jgi:hypothetical protein
VGTGFIEVRRERHFGRDMFRSYEVAIGRSDSVVVKNGETARIAVPAGSYLVQATISWCKSPIIRVVVDEGEVLRIACEPNLAAKGMPVRGSAVAANYISLRVEDEPE